MNMTPQTLSKMEAYLGNARGAINAVIAHHRSKVASGSGAAPIGISAAYPYAESLLESENELKAEVGAKYSEFFSQVSRLSRALIEEKNNWGTLTTQRIADIAVKTNEQMKSPVQEIVLARVKQHESQAQDHYSHAQNESSDLMPHEKM
jgi:hypothetical protein